jgi:hypothetical protein
MRYRDTRTGATYEPSSAFVAEMMAKNPALVPLDAAEPEPVNLSALTVATLRALCGERGIEAPKRATKAQLLELLEG